MIILEDKLKSEERKTENFLTSLCVWRVWHHSGRHWSEETLDFQAEQKLTPSALFMLMAAVRFRHISERCCRFKHRCWQNGELHLLCQFCENESFYLKLFFFKFNVSIMRSSRRFLSMESNFSLTHSIVLASTSSPQKQNSQMYFALLKQKLSWELKQQTRGGVSVSA